MNFKNKAIELKEERPWYKEEIGTVISSLNSSEKGLSNQEVLKRLATDGPNVLPEGKEDGLFKIFLNQFKSPLIYVLLVAGFTIILVGEFTDSIIIFAVLLTNALIGSFQEGKAQKTLKSLKLFSKGRAVVLRDNIETEVSDENIVVGDIIIVRGGDKVPADARIVSTQSFKVDEAALTGESESIEKTSDFISINVDMPDRKNMLFKGTLAVSGIAKAIVVSIGTSTYIGKISLQISDIASEAPLKNKIRQLSRVIGVATLVAVFTIATIGIFRGLELKEVFFTATAIAVSLIPEGLPVVITLILARGVYAMARRNALVKNMQAVEALGQAKVIAVDKTGTITKNELMIQKLHIDGKDFTITGTGYEPKGDIYKEGLLIEAVNHKEILFAGKIASLSADATVTFLENSKAEVSGDPTEAAQLVFGQKVGFNKQELEVEEEKVFEEPFSYEHKFRITLHKSDKKFLLTVVGEPESILPFTTKIWAVEGERSMTVGDRSLIDEKIREYSIQGLRVILFAISEHNTASVDVENLPEMTFVGIFGMADVLREEVVLAVENARNSGIRVVMITGDHLETAKAIAIKAHIWQEGDRILTGSQMAMMSERELEDSIDDISVFGRVLPEHKLKIVEAYKSKGYTIGMTGDGVNDALSLKAAHLGIAMGNGGTEVAKEAADIILLDNNFSSIVAAIEEGRSIYTNIKNVLVYLISTGIGEFLTIAVAITIGLSLPLLPNQILWLNLVTDGFLVVALAFEPKVKLEFTHRMSGKLFDTRRFFRSLFMGAVMMAGTLYVFYGALVREDAQALTLTLTTLSVFQWFNVWNCRSDRDSVFKKMFSNIYLVAGLVVVVVLHIFALYNPFMQNLLGTSPLNFGSWVEIVVISSSIIWFEEIRKVFVRLRKI